MGACRSPRRRSLRLSVWAKNRPATSSDIWVGRKEPFIATLRMGEVGADATLRATASKIEFAAAFTRINQ